MVRASLKVQVPAAVRQTIFTKMEHIELAFVKSKYIQVEPRYFEMLKAIWDDVSQIWGGIVGPDYMPQLKPITGWTLSQLD